MKQVIQNYRSGKLELADVPVPICSGNRILVKNIVSLISIGSERSVIELGKKNLLEKARARPDLVKRFMEKSKKEGFLKTYKEAMERLDNPTALGYSSAGMVSEVGKNVHSFSPGDMVACIGASYASHAEYITVPENLCCKIPATVKLEEASFGMLGIIAMHGVRCAKLAFGESVAVIGLGLLGLLSVQILKAYGCRVIGTDIDPGKVALANKLGIDYACTSGEELAERTHLFTDGYGADAVLITAATQSSAPVNTAVDISKFRGRIVLVGVADINPGRNEMWHKEVELIVSKAGGPGTLDPLYENKGIDYPAGYVRWTENRNLEEFLRLLHAGKVTIQDLISHRFKIEDAEEAYSNMLQDKRGQYIGVVLQYPESDNSNTTAFEIQQGETIIVPTAGNNGSRYDTVGEVNVGIIGAGLFARSLLLPALKTIRGIKLHTLSTASSSNVYHTAKKYGIKENTTDYNALLNNREINSAIILTPHSLHAKMVIKALTTGKHVFVEKPLCINEVELDEIEKYAAGSPNNFLMVGYNRRFSPHITKVRDYICNSNSPSVIHYRINAGFVPSDHWVHSEEEGGSRVIGEVCHFVDVMQYLTGSNPSRVYAERVSGDNKTTLNSDNIAITIKFKNGSIGNIIYAASGDKAFSREQIELFTEGKTIVMRDYKETHYHYSGKKKTFKTMNQEIGYKEELQHFFDVISGKSSAGISADEIFCSTRTVFKINESLSKGIPINI